MAFPQTPLPLTVEAYLAGDWVGITSKVRGEDGVTITRGRADEATSAEPSRCRLVLNNHDGRFSTRNPLGPYYGTFGRNTPIRVSLGITSDQFARTVASGWGSTPAGEAWSTSGAGGTVAASDYSVSGGVGVHSVPARNAYRSTYLSAVSWRDVDVAVTVTLPFSDVTGGDVEPAGILLRWQSSTDYYLVRVVLTSTETVGIAILQGSTVLQTPVTVAGLTYSGQALRVRAVIEGQTIRAKVWPASGPEPAGWHLVYPDSRIATSGPVGVRSGVATANSNTLPIVFSYDNVVVRSPRYTGEVSEWPPRWDTSGRDAWVEIEASGIRRRLGSRQAPAQSVLRRTILGLTNLVAYWPCEEGKDATQIGAAVGGIPMRVVGSPGYGASTDDFVASDPLPELAGSDWYAPVADHPTTGATQLRFLLYVPAAATDLTVLARVYTTGTTAFWEIVYRPATNGGLRLDAYTTAGTLVLGGGGATDFALHGVPGMLALELTQNGADIDWRLARLPVGAPSGGFIGGTLTGQTFGRISGVHPNFYNRGTDIVVGHYYLQSTISTLFDLASQLAAYAGEAVHTRLQRLCDEAVVDLSRTRFADGETTNAVGPQRSAALLALLDEAAAVGQGVLYEPRSALGLAYRSLHNKYNQTASVAASLSGGHLSELDLVDDDQLTRNDVTIEREGGSSARATLDTGPMSTADPALGGVGRYNDSVTLNVRADAQLGDIAGWQLHLGTTDEPRYPSIVIDRHRAPVAANTALSQGVLEANIDDRITVTGAAGRGLYDGVDQLIRGVTETMGNFEHRIAFQCTPAAGYDVITLDDGVSALDSDTTTLAEDLTTTETGVDVAIADGVLWTTAPADLPFAIRVGGEVMTVTAVTGTTSPQTFTVTRSVNGVVKTHSTGAQVRLARTPYLAH